MTAPLTGEDGPVYLTTREVAQRFRTAPSTVNEWRQKGTGPLGIRFGKKVLYPLPEVEAYEQRLIEAARRQQRQNATAGAVVPMAGRTR